MTSQQIDDTLLVAYVDGELHPVTARLVEDHIAVDPMVRDRVEMFRTSGDLLRAALAEPGSVPLPLRTKVDRILAQPGGRRLKPVWLSLAVAAGIAGLLIVGNPALRVWIPGSSAADSVVAHILDEVGDYHSVFAQDRSHLVEVPAARRAEIESWLGQRLGLAFRVPDLSAFDMEFQGGRLLAIDKQPVAQLMYTGKDGVPVALCIALTSSSGETGWQVHQEDGLTLYGRRAGSHVLVVVGEAVNPALRAVADAMPGLLIRS